jgi:hypothetical protein
MVPGLAGADAGVAGNSLAAGEIIAISAGDQAQLDVGLAVRVLVQGPAWLAIDPDEERVVYALGKGLHLSVQPDSAARPYALELATPCGSLRIPRSAEVDVRMLADGDCIASLEAGGGLWELPGALQESAIALDAGAPLRCSLAGACARQAARGAGEMPLAAILIAQAERLAARLKDGTADVLSMHADAVRAVGRLRPGERGPEALAMQRKLAHEAAFGLGTRFRLRSLLHAYGASVLGQDDPWHTAASTSARAALRPDP